LRYKTLFRIICKALGLYFAVTGTGGLLSIAAVTLMTWSGGSSTDARMFLPAVGSLFHLCAGLYLFFGARRVADLAVPANRPYCPECGYELTGNLGPVCPECGVHHRGGERNNPPLERTGK
jgi:hypothetical protein